MGNDDEGFTAMLANTLREKSMTPTGGVIG